jgi:transcriptional regulator with XRE-family HTH domain
MTGREWAAWRGRLGYSQQTIMRELDIRSRQTISNWENSEEVPRLAVLALHALEHHPDCQTTSTTFTKGASRKVERAYYASMATGGRHE